jgi:hypothetical protein
VSRPVPTRVGRCAFLFLAILAALPASVLAASIEAKHGAVAAEHRLASMAGLEMLERGGNAMDAAVAAALATGVVNPSSSGLGGGGFLVWWNARREKAATIDFRETAPRGATESMYVRTDGSVDPEASRTGALAVGVPGEPRGLALALGATAPSRSRKQPRRPSASPAKAFRSKRILPAPSPPDAHAWRPTPSSPPSSCTRTARPERKASC